MAFWGDYHTHTIHSHGKGTIEQNVQQAIAKGLKEIAITDHGFKHMAFNVKREEWDNIRAEHNSIANKYPQIKIYLGIESNLYNKKGDIDIENNDFPLLDIIVAGYHKWVHKGLGFFVSNTFGLATTKIKNRNTNAFIKAIERYPIDIISHPQAGISLDIVEVSNAAANFGTFFELNGKRIPTTDLEFQQILEKTQVEFIANSDAHAVHKVANYDLPQSIIDRVGIPTSRIVNWEKLPNFRSRINKEYASQ